jgi:hypothetical protein
MVVLRKARNLYIYLRKNGQEQEAEELRRLMQETEEDPIWQDIQDEPPALDDPPTMSPESTELIEGRMPKFDWLLKGQIFRNIYQQDSRAYLEFLDANSAALMDFNEPTYLGSGAMADAWIVDGERVLKIFDTNSYAGNQEPSMRQYQNIYSKQWFDTDDEAIKNPMIYGLGMFDTTYRISQMRTKGHYSRGNIQLGWVLMEHVQTVDDLANRYIKDSGDTINLERDVESPPPDEEDEFDWDDDWNPTEENPDFKMGDLYEVYENSYFLRSVIENKWGGDFRHVEPGELIKNLVSSVVDSIVFEIKEKIERYNDEEYEYAEDQDEYEDEEEWEESRHDLDDEESLDSFVESEIESLVLYGGDGESVVNEESVALVERILGINQRADLESGEISPVGTSIAWIKDIVMEAIRKDQQGYGDTHSGNFGFRKEVDEDGNYKNRPIFFDA